VPDTSQKGASSDPTGRTAQNEYEGTGRKKKNPKTQKNVATGGSNHHPLLISSQGEVAATINEGQYLRGEKKRMKKGQEGNQPQEPPRIVQKRSSLLGKPPQTNLGHMLKDF